MTDKHLIPLLLLVVVTIFTACGGRNRKEYNPSEEDVKIFYGFVPDDISSEEEYDEKYAIAVSHMGTDALKDALKTCNECLSRLKKEINADETDAETRFYDKFSYASISHERFIIRQELIKRRAIRPRKEDRIADSSSVWRSCYRSSHTIADTSSCEAEICAE